MCKQNKNATFALNCIYMKLLRNIFFKSATVALFLGACIMISVNGYAQPSRRDKGEKSDILSRETAVVKRVSELPEVKAKARELESKSRGRQKVRYNLHRKPDESIPYYWVKVEQNTGEEFVTIYDFFVHQTSPDIKYYDAIKDTLIDLETWRRRL